MNRIRTCVTPEGKFIYGIHKPNYNVANMRQDTRVTNLGHLDGNGLDNSRNYPEQDVEVKNADWIFEIPNPFPFKGATYIDKEWADASTEDYGRIRIPGPEPVSFTSVLSDNDIDLELFSKLPEPVLLSLATCSTDPADLTTLAKQCCSIEFDVDGTPIGLSYTEQEDGSIRPLIHNQLLFEAVANNPHLPDSYKIVMVIRPGAQGGSEIVGEFPAADSSHIYEYLRRNSYIAGGHYAANMAEDAIRYSINDLGSVDIQGLRHLYYQRSYIRLAEELDMPLSVRRRILTPGELEDLRAEIISQLQHNPATSTATLWGWNFGFDYAPSRYRLHASHQQIHQQYAMLPDKVLGYSGRIDNSEFTLPAFGCGDLIADVMQRYRAVYDRDFFVDYLAAIEHNQRMDERSDLEKSLIVWRDDNVILFVPKAQTSQWELQLMTLDNTSGYPAGNIVEADGPTRKSLDTGILKAQRALAGIGASMVTSIEYPKRIGVQGELGQPLLYAFLPRLPESPGAFSETQLRFINGHYPEDFAAVCRSQI